MFIKLARGGKIVNKDDLIQYHDETNLSLKRKKNEEVLEISSTGYGLEPVSAATEEEHQVKNRSNSSNGGL